MYLRSKTQGRLRCQKRRSLSQPVKKPQNHFHEYRQKVTVTTLFQTAFHRVFQLLPQMAHVCLHSESGYTLGFRRKIAHSCLHAETGGVSDGGGITTLGAFRTFTNIPGPGIRTANFAAFGAWSGAPKERRKPSEQRCAYARRCSEGVAAPLGCVICLQLGDVAVFFTLCAVLSERARWGWYHYPRSVSHGSETLRGQGVERQTLPFSEVG